MSAPTPGPWNLSPGCDEVVYHDCYPIALALNGVGSDWIGVNPIGVKRAAANARLIAAAPDLLDAVLHLRWCRSCGEGSLEDCDGGRDALAAIAKATGEPAR